MIWEGQKIRHLSKENKISLEKVAKQINVSRRTVYDWIAGQIPKGSHLISLCKIFNVNPDFFFTNNLQEIITLPVHRKRGTAKISEKTKDFSLELAKEFQILFKNPSETNIVPVIRGASRTDENALKIASTLRKYSGVSDDNTFPLNYKSTLKLMDNLGITVILKKFPEQIKSYTFYCKIYNHRIVFINYDTNIIDLIFPLLHESVHAVRDEVFADNIYDNDEENFCDTVANYIQFTQEYTDIVYEAISGSDIGIQINKLKNLGGKYFHSLYGITKRIEKEKPDITFNYSKICAANENFKKTFPTIGEILFDTDDPIRFVQNLSTFFPKFFTKLVFIIDNITDRKLGELLNLDSYLDAVEIKKVIKKIHQG